MMMHFFLCNLPERNDLRREERRDRNKAKDKKNREEN